jgi:hypothetical protein
MMDARRRASARRVIFILGVLRREFPEKARIGNRRVTNGAKNFCTNAALRSARFAERRCGRS